MVVLGQRCVKRGAWICSPGGWKKIKHIPNGGEKTSEANPSKPQNVGVEGVPFQKADFQVP